MLLAVRTTLISALIAVSLSGCGATPSGQVTTHRAAISPVRAADSGLYILALKGGIIARAIGLSLKPSDNARALEAEYKALEIFPSGQAVVWAGGTGTSGQVVAAAPYQVGAQNCHQYSHSVTVPGGKNYVGRGAACRNADGSWTPLI